MKLRNVLIVVSDIEESINFYRDLFGLQVVLNNDGNVIMTEGLVLQDKNIWKDFLEKDVVPQNCILKKRTLRILLKSLIIADMKFSM